nr:LacI family DNA-binding transcriptional regulator [Enterococcus faecium]
MTTIAKHCGVSWSTVSRTLASLIPMTKVKKKLVTALFING